MSLPISQVDSLLQGLNYEQKAAVTASSDSHTLVLAGAGCGKTTVLTKRIAYCALNGTRQEKICALTFTRKAAEEMALRVMPLSGINKNQPLPLITTFHGLGLRVLSEKIGGSLNFTKIGFQNSVHLLSDRERLEMLANITSKKERDILQVDLLRLDSLLIQKSVFPEKQSYLTLDQRMVLESIDKRLCTKKRENSVWDFSDLITGLIQLFEQYPDLAKDYAFRFNAVLVDEFQDTNPLQIKLLHILLSGGSTLFAVGDDDQAIYGFRGADIRPTIEFCNYFSGAKILKLQTNYRSVPIILDTANRLFINKNPAYRKVLVSGRYTKKDNMAKPSVHRFENMEKMILWVISKIKIIEGKESIPIDKMAILFRINQTLDRVALYLKNNTDLVILPQLLTVHRSKGLEFPVVFLCDLEESVFPSYRMPSTPKIGTLAEMLSYLRKKKKRVQIDCDWDEEKRLFYVGITRAQKYLYFISIKNKLVYSRMRSFEPSRLLKLL